MPNVEYPILKEVSGQIPLHKTTAIYGPTGSGKTSLLNALAFRLPFIKDAKLTGSILYDNKILE